MNAREEAVVIVGAGASGLACAIDLAASGVPVTVFDRATHAGGKIRSVRIGDRHVDVGPTVLTMKWVLEDLLATAGAPETALPALERSEILARHAWPDGTTLDLHGDGPRSEDAIGAAFGAAEARGYHAFMADARRIYEAVEGPFLRSQRPTLAQIATRGLGVIPRMDALRAMSTAIEARFSDPRLRQLFGRYATYCGTSPFDAPATLNLVAHVEACGVHRVRGGMRALAAALGRLAVRAGARLRLGEGVARILVEGGRARGVVVEGGERVSSRAVVFTGEASALASGLLGEAARDALKAAAPEARSLSAVTWATVARAEGFPLVHHNVFFSPDYPAEFRAIAAGRTPEAPTVYLCAQDRGDVARAASGEEPVLLIVNAPPTGDAPERWSETEKRQCDRALLGTLRACGLSLSPTAWARTTPAEFAALFPATGGALYGPRPCGLASLLSRPGATSRIPGLLLAGGSVHPGAGVPLAILSGRRAAERVRAGLASTKRSRPGATSGTTSTG